jgi:hypothetical protein
VNIVIQVPFEVLHPELLFRWIVSVVPEEGFYESQNKFQLDLKIVARAIQKVFYVAHNIQ